jgi:hypothetical protein
MLAPIRTTEAGMQHTTPPLIDAIPDPQSIRARLTDLAVERDLLRSLLRLLEQRECGRRLMRRRREQKGDPNNAT